jgi:hypothetical protein
MELTIKITEFGNDALVDDLKGEVTRAIGAALERSAFVLGEKHLVQDNNGNTIGTLEISI